MNAQCATCIFALRQQCIAIECQGDRHDTFCTTVAVQHLLRAAAERDEQCPLWQKLPGLDQPDAYRALDLGDIDS